jgi:curli biogenesis system outer membrane secretion channel CsgG
MIMCRLDTLIFVFMAWVFVGCGTESHRTVEDIEVTVNNNYKGKRAMVAIGKFANKSPYLNGIFSNNQDKLGNQAKEILKSQLILTNRFDLLDRDNLENLAVEAKLSGDKQNVLGAKYIFTGAVTDFARKTSGGKIAFGILGRTKHQVAYAKVTINVIEVKTSRSIYSVLGAGEFQLSTTKVLGTGSSAGYDATLNGKVLNLAIVNAINKLVKAIETGQCTLNASE